MIIRRDKCLLCGAKLRPLKIKGIQAHPKVANCRVEATDEWGIALTLDERAALMDVQIVDPEPAAPRAPESEIDGLLFGLYPTVENTLANFFKERGLPRLGGPSTGNGWSSFSLWQRCPYAWSKRYIEKTTPEIWSESDGLAIGSIIHTHMALFYSQGIDGSPYVGVTPEDCHKYVLNNATPAFANEAWRVFTAYRLFYKFEELVPLAVEYDLKDPRTGESTRYDLVAYLPKERPGLLAGTYLFEHKSASVFSFDTLEGWANDGEVLGEIALWDRLGLDNYFGPLRGTVVNLLGKQKEPKFHRTIVSPSRKLIDSHLNDLRLWQGTIGLSKATGIYQRARANCINRHGRCDWFEHCASGED